MFGRIAARYDLMNTLMTFGQDRGWRTAVAELVPDSQTVLDVGTGTGRLAQAVVDAHPSARVIGVDFTQAMLRRAPRQLQVARADALQLPFENEEFDAVVSAFLLRNVADVSQAIAEQVRVLRPGGVLAILETTPGPIGVLRPGYRLYFRHMVPLMGNLIAGDASAYTYLPESTLSFVEPARLVHLLRDHGLPEVRTRRLGLGSVAITHGRKPVLGDGV
jgi:demethylmenaquinone methyltransferase/2-methoxy-6-polyprenyl-1,4-benzoquinol methylase